MPSIANPQTISHGQVERFLLALPVGMRIVAYRFGVERQASDR